MLFKKKRLYTTVAFLLIATSAFCQPITRQAAISLVKNQIIGDDTLNYNIYMYPSVYPQAYCVCRNGDTVYNPYAYSRMFFIDKMPHYNWGHTCSYIYIDTTSGNYSHIAHDFFPFGFKGNLDSISFAYPDSVLWSITPSTSPTEYRNLIDPHKYAVIFTGDTVWQRWNDISHMYSALKFNGFSDENIFLFVPSYEVRSQDYDKDLVDDVDGASTYENIENTLSDLQETLTEKDIFYFFCTTHGGTTDYSGNSYLILENGENVLNDDELASMVEDFSCSEMIFIIDACFSGGFVTDLQGNHRTVQTCTDEANPMWLVRSFAFNFLTYAYATVLKGCHPKVYPDFQPWTKNCGDGTIGNQDLSLVWSGWDDKDDIDPDEVENGGNGDGFYQLGEVFRYAAYLRRQIENQGENYQNHGTIEDLLNLYGLVGNVDNTQTISGNFLIGDLVTVKDGVTLTIDENSVIYLNHNYTTINDPQILVEDNATLVVDDDVSFWGYDDHNHIDIEGSLSMGSHDIFSAPEEIRWTGLNLLNTLEEYEISTCSFTNCNLSANCLELLVNACEFSNSFLDFSHGDLTVENACEFTNAGISLSYPYDGNSSVDISDCYFYNEGYSNGSSIDIDGYSNYIIDNCIIEHDYHAHGIGIFNAGGVSSQKLIRNCEVYNAPSRTNYSTNGALIYDSYAIIYDNKFYNNGIGIALCDNSITNIEGEVEFSSEEETQVIKDNVYKQVSISENCFPQKFIWNAIYNQNLEGIFVSYYGSCDQEEFDVSDNYWGGLDNLNDYLSPEGCYAYNPVWQFKTVNFAKMLYDSAINLVNTENYLNAEILYKEIIQSFPSSIYASSSVKDLYYLMEIYNQDYQGLQDYYDSVGTFSEFPSIHKLMGFFSNRCDIELGNYQSAINWNDSIILQPESMEDSIFAVIDRDYIYMLMQHENLNSKSIFIPAYVPRTFKDFIVKRDDLLTFLLTSNVNSLGIDDPNEIENSKFENCLNQNFPNPFRDKTTFTFTLNEEAQVSIIIFDQLGRQIVKLPGKYCEKGTNSIDFVNGNLSPGIYYYQIAINDKIAGAQKLLVY